MRKHYVFIFIFILFLGNTSYAKTLVAKNIDEFNQLKNELLPGDTLMFSNGIWNNATLIINNKGTNQSPIIFISETPGKVIFTGNSTLRVAGEYVEVNGLEFVNGYSVDETPVIAFRDNGKNLANHCRITNCVIDNYNNPDRLTEDNWVAIYGKHNRFDHNYIANKKNLGTTLVVKLNDVLNRDNEHRIDHNYFGERPRLGSNGGETLRIGTSTFSRTTSKTLVEDNYFEHCNGEVEIISVKSMDNIIRRNTFFECEGTLTLRHGDSTTINGNYFIGNDKPNTGGVRVINAHHKIYDNFFYKLAGDGFRSALAILNGVPNSPINRYYQVKDVAIANNVFIDCNSVTLSAGKDLEKTARPEDVLIAGNIFDTRKHDLFDVEDTLSGIKFSDNYSTIALTSVPSGGFIKGPVNIQRTNDTWKIVAPKNFLSAKTRKVLKQRLPGVDLTMPETFSPYATPENTGVKWYKIKAAITPAGKRIEVAPGENTLYEKSLTVAPNDTLVLSSGTYNLNKTIFVKTPLNIIYNGDLHSKPVIQFDAEKSGFSFFSIENGGQLNLQNIKFNGLSAHGTAESFIRTSLQPMIEHYNLFVDGCDFMNITDSRKYALKVNKASYADTIQYTNCIFSNISGPVISIAAEKEDLGIYNAENVIFKNCLFNKLLYSAIVVYRGGNDQSTTGPYFTMDHCTFNEVANIDLGSVVQLIGVQHSNITNCIFNNSGRAGRMVKYEDYGWTKNSISYCDAFHAGRIESFYNNIIGKQMLKLNPQFINISEMNFQLSPTSRLKGKGNDGKDMGCIWKNNILNNH